MSCGKKEAFAKSGTSKIASMVEVNMLFFMVLALKGFIVNRL
jgi:hypothetical protein